MTDYLNPALKRPKRVSLPKNLIFLDTEADNISQSDDELDFKFRMACLIFVELDDKLNQVRRNVYFCDELIDFYLTLDDLVRDYQTVYVFGHNLGFDLRILGAFRELSKLGFKGQAPIINHRIFMWNVKRNHQTIHFIDTANFAVISVAQIGKDIGLPKLEVDFNTVSDVDLHTYCQRDCEILEKFILEYLSFLHHFDLGGFKHTLASQALHTFLYRFYDDNIFPHHWDKLIDIEKECYHGGRSEAFFIGQLPDKPYYAVDINSMYPSIMRDEYVPIKLEKFFNRTIPELTADMFNRYYVIARCTIRTQEPVFAKVINKRLCFPVGRMEITLHHSELEYAHKHKLIVSINTLVLYRKAKVFSRYADFFLNKRREFKELGNDSWSYICKIKGNSLYGKLAQHNYKREKLDNFIDTDFGRMPFTDTEKGITGQIIIWDGEVIKEYKEGISRHSFMAIAGAITAYGRMLLWRLILKAGRLNVFYVDTDSLIVNEAGYLRLTEEIDKTLPGKLKLEKVDNRLIIHGAKDYEHGNKIRRKGIKEKATVTKDGAFEQFNFDSVVQWLNSGGEGTVKAHRVVKRRSGLYTKGNVDGAGTVIPITLA